MEKTHINYDDFLNFGNNDEIIALSQFVHNIERNLPTINLQLHRQVCLTSFKTSNTGFLTMRSQ